MGFAGEENKKEKKKTHYFLLCPNTEKDLMGHLRGAERLVKKRYPPQTDAELFGLRAVFNKPGKDPV